MTQRTTTPASDEDDGEDGDGDDWEEFRDEPYKDGEKQNETATTAQNEDKKSTTTIVTSTTSASTTTTEGTPTTTTTMSPPTSASTASTTSTTVDPRMVWSEIDPARMITWCIALSDKHDYKWTIEPCDMKRRFICELGTDEE